MSERDIFIAALQEEDPAQRRAYLDGACAGQPELRRQVENLLRLHEGAGSFLEEPAAGAPATRAFPNASAHAEAGDFDKAIEFQEKALSFPEYEKQYGKIDRERLQLWARKQPYRDPRFVPREILSLPEVER